METNTIGYRHVKLSRKMTQTGGITIPAVIRKELGFKGKDLFTIEVDRQTGDILLKRVKGTCILTGETDNLIEVNGRYISYEVLSELNGELSDDSLLDHLIPDGSAGEQLEKDLKEEEKEYRKVVKARLEKKKEITIDDQPMTVRIKDVYDADGNLVISKKDRDKLIAEEEQKKSKGIKKNNSKKKKKAKTLEELKSNKVTTLPTKETKGQDVGKSKQITLLETEELTDQPISQVREDEEELIIAKKEVATSNEGEDEEKRSTTRTGRRRTRR